MWKAFDELEAIGWIGSEATPHGRGAGGGARHRQGLLRRRRGTRTPLGERPYRRRWHSCACGRRGFLILRAVRESGGFATAVSDEAIFDAQARVAQEEGLLLCPEGAATFAYEQALAGGQISSSERTVLFNCATGPEIPHADRASRPRSSSTHRLRRLCLGRFGNRYDFMDATGSSSCDHGRSQRHWPRHRAAPFAPRA